MCFSLSAPKESYEAVAYRLLDKVVAAELVSATISTKVKTYTERHSLKLDHVLLNYVKVSHMVGVHFSPFFHFPLLWCFFHLQIFLSQAPRYTGGALTDSPYEAKAIALVQAIHDKEVVAL